MDSQVFSHSAATPTWSLLDHLRPQPVQLHNRRKLVIFSWSQKVHKYNPITKMGRGNSLRLCSGNSLQRHRGKAQAKNQECGILAQKKIF